MITQPSLRTSSEVRRLFIRFNELEIKPVATLYDLAPAGATWLRSGFFASYLTGLVSSCRSVLKTRFAEPTSQCVA
jgi:hypothetical protein